MVTRLLKAGVTANQVTLTAMFVSVALGLFLYFFHRAAGKPTAWLLLFPLWMLVRMAFNAIDGMLARELQTSTFLGAGVAIPHGTNEARAHIKSAALGFLQFPDGIDWDGQTAYVIIPIASNSDEHIGILSALASTLADKTKSAKLRTVTSVDEVLDLLTPEEEE